GGATTGGGGSADADFSFSTSASRMSVTAWSAIESPSRYQNPRAVLVEQVRVLVEFPRERPRLRDRERDRQFRLPLADHEHRHPLALRVLHAQVVDDPHPLARVQRPGLPVHPAALRSKRPLTHAW